jgi:polyhydroxyalkanoate synthesis repressor PhaR
MAADAPPTQSAAPETEPIPITRYPNRRLYDRSQGKYITLQQIADMVRQGKTVAVRDSRTGDDLTRAILTQIILEHHPDRMELLPVAVLNSMIRANEATLVFLRDYFGQALGYLDLLQRSAAVNPLVLPLTWMRALFPNLPPSNPPPASQPPSDAEKLMQRIAELERRVEAQTTREARKPGKKK